MVRDVGADLCYDSHSFMAHSDACVVVMDICATDTGMRSFDQDLVSCECRPSDGFGYNGAVGGASEGFECDGHCS